MQSWARGRPGARANAQIAKRGAPLPQTVEKSPECISGRADAQEREFALGLRIWARHGRRPQKRTQNAILGARTPGCADLRTGTPWRLPPNATRTASGVGPRKNGAHGAGREWRSAAPQRTQRCENGAHTRNMPNRARRRKGACVRLRCTACAHVAPEAPAARTAPVHGCLRRLRPPQFARQHSETPATRSAGEVATRSAGGMTRKTARNASSPGARSLKVRARVVPEAPTARAALAAKRRPWCLRPPRRARTWCLRPPRRALRLCVAACGA